MSATTPHYDSGDHVYVMGRGLGRVEERHEREGEVYQAIQLRHARLHLPVHAMHETLRPLPDAEQARVLFDRLMAPSAPTGPPATRGGASRKRQGEIGETAAGFEDLAGLG